MNQSFSQKIEKPWGFEILYTQPESPLVGKLAFTKAGHRWSFQYHDKKEEDICLIEGEAKIWLGNEKGEIEKSKMEPYLGYHVKPFQKHRFCAVTDCWTVETSTPETGNTVRIEDDYQRDTETEQVREQANRGWKG